MTPATARISLAAAAGVGFATTDAGTGFTASAEGRTAVALGPIRRAVLAVGFDRASSTVRGGPASGSTLDVVTLPIRLGVGGRVGWAELRLGGLARPYFTRGLGERDGIVWGAWAALAVEAPRRGPVAAFGILGVDLHPQPITFSYAGQAILGVRVFAPWVGVGVAWRGSAA